MRKLNKTISTLVSNKKGAGEISVILILMVLGMFFWTRYVFDIPFPFTKDNSKGKATVNQGSDEQNKIDKSESK